MGLLILGVCVSDWKLCLIGSHTGQCGASMSKEGERNVVITELRRQRENPLKYCIWPHTCLSRLTKRRLCGEDGVKGHKKLPKLVGSPTLPWRYHMESANSNLDKIFTQQCPLSLPVFV